MKSYISYVFKLLLISNLFISLSCNPYASYRYWATKKIAPKQYNLEDQLGSQKPSKYAKLHTKDGQVYVLNSWTFIKKDGVQTISGKGNLYSRDRKITQTGALSVAINDLVLIESTHPREFKQTSKLLLGIGIGVAVVGMFCLANAKSCFGSCPTIYNGELEGDDLEEAELLAEGFSDAIAPSLESTDLDPLNLTRWSKEKQSVTLTLTNEAYETHAIRKMDVWAVDLPNTEFVDIVHTPMPEEGHLYPVTTLQEALSCQSSATGDCLANIQKADYTPHLAPAHSQDLGHREVITITLPNPYESAFKNVQKMIQKDDVQPAVILSIRNSLLNTFIFYQLWAWLGKRAGDWVIHLENLMGNNIDHKQSVGKSTFKRISAALGDLQVEVLNKDTQHGKTGWITVGSYDEIGPLAQEKVVLLLPKSLPAGPVYLRLTSAQGNFRLDQVALALAGPELTPRHLQPSMVRTQDKRDKPNLLKILNDQDEYLVTYPGDLFYLDYNDQKGSEQTRYFLESTGHYIEWQQPSWLREQNEESFMDFLLDPEQGLRKLAPKYKEIEPKIEELFWNSRFRINGGE